MRGLASPLQPFSSPLGVSDERCFLNRASALSLRRPSRFCHCSGL